MKAYQTLLKKAKEKIENIKNIQIFIGDATCENAAGAKDVYLEFERLIKESKREDIDLKKVGCTGRCSLEPIVSILIKNNPVVTYKKVSKKDVLNIFDSHIQKNEEVKDKLLNPSCKIFSNKSEEQKKLAKEPITHDFFEFYGKMPFYCMQTRVALRNAGLINPEDIFDYIYHKGFQSLDKVLEKDSEFVLKEIEDSKLRGRGGAGFYTHQKWKFAIQEKEKTKYIICNADEGDPGAFMDRGMLESDPFSIIEGMIIAGFTLKAKKGFFNKRYLFKNSSRTLSSLNI